MGIGIIRLLFAFSIVLTHAGKIYGFNFADPVVSVESFYIISGFYMTMILTEKYKSRLTFYLNRALRLYPIYFAVLILTVLLGKYGTLSSFLMNVSHLNPITFLMLLLTNITIIGQDILLFLGINANGWFFFTTDFRTVSLPAHTFLMIPQAWTIGLELWFYLIAPFLIKRKSIHLVLLAVLSLCIRWYLTGLGLNFDPWTYRFFPSELSLFIFGIFSYRIFTMFRYSNIPRRISGVMVVLVVAVICMFQYIHVPYMLKQWAFYVLLTGVLPFTFLHARKNIIDRKIGELSYPVYISHVCIMGALAAVSPWLNSYLTMYHTHAYPVFILLVSLVFSQILLTVVQNPVERIRMRLAGSRSG